MALDIVLSAGLIAGCKEGFKDIEPWQSGNIAENYLPDVHIYKAYRMQYGPLILRDGDIHIYYVSWGGPEGRIVLNENSMEIKEPIGKSMWENSWIDNPDSQTVKKWAARIAVEGDSLPKLVFKKSIIVQFKPFYDSLINMGLDTMTSASPEHWDIHDWPLLIFEVNLNGNLNIFEIQGVEMEKDFRYKWLHTRIKPLLTYKDWFTK